MPDDRRESDKTIEQLQAEYFAKGDDDRAFAERVKAAGGVRAFMRKHNTAASRIKDDRRGMGGI